MVHGFSTAIWWSFGILALAAVLAFVLINAGSPGAGGAGEGSGAGAADANEVPVLVH